MSWEKDTEWEAKWWGTCQNTLGEEQKQLKYAELMGLKMFKDSKSPFNIDMGGKSVLDIGGGPISLLLKCHKVQGTIVDPCNYPKWVEERYNTAGIRLVKLKAEDYRADVVFDEVWIYNVLQHVEDVSKVVKNALDAGRLVRVFEWLDNGISPGHPQNLTESGLNELFKGEGKVAVLKEPTLTGKTYCGVFKGTHYANI